MCGRYTLRTPTRDIVELFELSSEQADPAAGNSARFNIAPSQDLFAVRMSADGRGRELAQLRWGLVPPWAEDPAIGNQLINARAETVATKPAFREAFRTRRCLLPADGFFEWKRQGRAKQPYFIRLKDERPFAFAGLWQHWRRGDQMIDSCAIITTASNELVRPLHDRMPVILDRQEFAAWLDPNTDIDALRALLDAYPSEQMAAYPVRTVVNSPAFDGPECIETAGPGQVQGSLFD